MERVVDRNDRGSHGLIHWKLSLGVDASLMSGHKRPTLIRHKGVGYMEGWIGKLCDPNTQGNTTLTWQHVNCKRCLKMRAR